jgi:hypothetical protein
MSFEGPVPWVAVFWPEDVVASDGVDGSSEEASSAPIAPGPAAASIAASDVAADKAGVVVKARPVKGVPVGVLIVTRGARVVPVSREMAGPMSSPATGSSVAWSARMRVVSPETAPPP